MKRSDSMIVQILFQKKWTLFLATFMIAIIGGLLFKVVNLPIPWLLGSMFFVFIWAKFFKQKLYWPSKLRDSAMIIVGYTIGLSFTSATFVQIGQQITSMILMTLLLLLFTLVISIIISKLSGIPFPTILIGSIPGGLSQMITLAEELEDVDITVVTFLQISRLMMIIFTVPLFIFSPLFDIHRDRSFTSTVQNFANQSDLLPNVLVFAVVCILFAILGKRINFPTAFLLGPMLATILLNLSGFKGPTLPSFILDCSQLMIGGYIGLLLKPENMKNKFKISILAICSGIVLLSFSFGLSILLTHLHSMNTVTSMLSLSPGGMDQMAIIAKEAHGDISVIMCYQLFRTLFIFIAVPYLLKFIFNRLNVRVADKM